MYTCVHLPVQRSVSFAMGAAHTLVSVKRNKNSYEVLSFGDNWKSQRGSAYVFPECFDVNVH